MAKKKTGIKAIIRAKVCPYCNCGTKIISGKEIYPHRSDLHSKRFTACEKFPACDAYVGHHMTGGPLGRLARKELRSLKSRVHAAFDPLWKRGNATRFSSRTDAYQWLAKSMNLQPSLCHIGMFNEDQCGEALEIIKSVREPSAAW